MNRLRAAGAVAALATLTASAGCGGGGETLVPVQGRVTQADGQPLAVGTVILHPDASKGNATLHEPRGTIDKDGTYEAVVGSRAVGAPPGWYKVTVYAGVPSNPKDEYSPEKLIIDKKFTDPSTSGIAFEVKPGAPPGAYDILLAK